MKGEEESRELEEIDGEIWGGGGEEGVRRGKKK